MQLIRMSVEQLGVKTEEVLFVLTVMAFSTHLIVINWAVYE